MKSVLHFAFLHLSGYYYYDYVVIGVLRLLLLRLCSNRCAEATIITTM